MANPMGFTAAIRKKKVKGKDLVEANLPKKHFEPKEIYLSFDSGKVISFNDARHHTLVFGTTGSGKTASVILPIIYNVMFAGHCAIIGDLKGSLAKMVRKIAKKLGIGHLIKEYGSGPQAEKLNLLAYMSEDGIRTFFERLALQMGPGDDSKIWVMKGVQNAADCAILLRWMARHDPAFEPTLGRVFEMINNIFDASRIYTIFLENYYDENDEKQRQFVNAVDNNNFHILKKLDWNVRTNAFKPYNEKGGDDQYNHQVTWNLQAIKMGLRAFLEAPGIEEHFSAPGAPGIDLGSDIMSGKFILLRFDSLTGKTGSFLTRSLLSEAYRIALQHKIEERNGRFFHVILDEFQEYADFSDNAGSDKHFVSLGREFGACMTAASQSMSSLACKVGSSAAVESFVGNCNNILSFYNHDAATQELVRRYDQKVRLNRLQPGRLFTVNYDSTTRKHRHGLEKLNLAYKEMCALFDNIPLDEPEEDAGGWQEDIVSLTVLTDNLLKDIEARKREEQERKMAERQAAYMKLKAQAATDQADEDDEDEDEDCVAYDWKQDDDKPEEGDEEERIMSEDFYNGFIDEADDEHEDAAEGAKSEKLFASELKSAFPQLFDRDFYSADIPAGWREFTLKTLHLFAATRLHAKIDFFKIVNGNLEARFEDGSIFAESVLNTLLKHSSSICMICGENIDKEGHEQNHSDEDAYVPLCSACLEKYSAMSINSDKPVMSS